MNKPIATMARTNEILAKYDLYAKKNFGQNFIIEPGIVEKIARLSQADARSAVIEIGPGIGALTEQLARVAGQVLAFEIDDRLIDVIAREDKILKYLDIPLQHCNDKILKKMNRRGDKKYLCALLEKLRERIPGLVLRTSIIAGLPGEGEEEFDELCDFLREQKLLRAGVFPYSPEEGTRAAKMERVDSDEAARRAERIVDIQSEIIDAWNDERQGDVMEVLCEGFDGQSMLFVGRSYAESPDIDGRIYFSAPRDVAAGEFVPVRITGAMDGELTGELAEE